MNEKQNENEDEMSR
jgi:hypothetical protein